jgi:tetratricopeptide (TPR) repeat protein
MPIDLPNPQGQRIDSWKEIAAFFGRDERTVKRWEGQRGLPVHRVPGGRGTVYAFTEELTAWLRSSQSKDAQEPAAPLLEADGALLDSAFEVPKARSESLGVSGGATASSRNWHTGLTLGLLASLIAVVLLLGPGLSKVRALLERSNIAERNNSPRHKDAEDLYMQGRYFWNKRTPEGLTLALDDFTKATKLDPQYALAYAGQADCYNLLREYTSMPPSQAFPLAIAAATKAVTLDERLPEGHRALGFAYFYWNWDLAGGERQFRQAIALNPRDVEAHHWYATALMAVSRYPEAVAEIEEARKLDPASSSIAADRGDIFYGAGRRDEGIRILLDLEKSEPTFLSPYVYLRNIYFDEKEYAKSFDQGEMVARMAHDDKALAAIEVGRKRLKQGGESLLLEGLLADQIAGFKQGNNKAIDVAETYALLSKNKEAMEYLEKGYQRHEYELINLGFWRGFDGLRGMPEYQDLLRRLGINNVRSAS